MAKVQELSKEVSKDVSFEGIVTNAIKIPGVKVNRTEFLTKTFEREDVDIHKIIDIGPVAAGCSEEMLARIANKLILTRTSESTAVSFAAGIPGGLAMAATIPADTLQFFGMTLRMAQELTYLYGASDLWKNGEVDSTKVRDQLILYCGVMFGVAGGITFASMRPMGKRLADTLDEANFKYSEEQAMEDYIVVEEMASEYEESAGDIAEEVVSIEETSEEESVNMCEKPTEEDVFEKIEKLAKLKNIGAITEEEFNLKKSELLDRI